MSFNFILYSTGVVIILRRTLLRCKRKRTFSFLCAKTDIIETMLIFVSLGRKIAIKHYLAFLLPVKS